MNVRTLAGAVSYFSVVPVPFAEGGGPHAAMFAYLPAIGLALGGAAGACAYGVAKLGPLPLAVAAAFGLSIAFTGALHVDGFLDSCDALFASVTPETRRSIMKDPHHGTFAVASFAVVCVVWIGALASLVPSSLPVAMAYAAGTARWSAAVAALRFPYARGGRPSWLPLVAMGIVLSAFSLLVAPGAWLAVPVFAVAALGGARWAAARLGGSLVGDVYGALILTVEVATLVSCALLRAR